MGGKWDCEQERVQARWYPPEARTDDRAGWSAVQQRFFEVHMHRELRWRFGDSWRLANRWRIAGRLYRYGLAV